MKVKGVLVKNKKLWPEKHEELLQAAERYARTIQHEFMTPEMDRFLRTLEEARRA